MTIEPTPSSRLITLNREKALNSLNLDMVGPTPFFVEQSVNCLCSLTHNGTYPIT